MTLQWKFEPIQMPRSKATVKNLKHGLNIGQTLIQYGPNNLRRKKITLRDFWDLAKVIEHLFCEEVKPTKA